MLTFPQSASTAQPITTAHGATNIHRTALCNQPIAFRIALTRIALVVLATSAIATSLAVAPATAQPRPGQRRATIFEQLDLTPEQETQLQDLHESNAQNRQDSRAQLRAEHDTLHDLLSGSASESELQSQFERVQALRQEQAQQRFNAMLDIRAILTPEQRAQLGELVAEHRHKRSQRFNSHRPMSDRNDRILEP